MSAPILFAPDNESLKFSGKWKEKKNNEQKHELF